MRINHNISALNAYRNLSVNNANTSKSLEKLSSGLRINRAADDAAGLAISEKMRSQIRGLDMAERNALDGISFIQTAEGALSSTHSILQRMRELSVQAANDSNTSTDREAIQKEMNQLTNEINRIGNTTEFNTKKLLNGDLEISGKPKSIVTNSLTATANLADLQVDQDSLVGNGKYKVEIKNLGGENYKYQNVLTNSISKTGAGTGDVSISPMMPSQTDDINLDAGNYIVVLNQKTGPVVASNSVVSGDSVLDSSNGNNPVTIDPNSALAPNSYNFGVTKTRNYAVEDGSGNPLSNVVVSTASPVEEGSYTFETKSVVDAGATDQYINSVTVKDDSSYTGAYQIKITQISDADTNAGTSNYSISLVDGNDIPVSGVNPIGFDVSANSGSQSFQLGDVSVDINLSTLWNSDNNHDGTNGAALPPLAFNVSKAVVATHGTDAPQQAILSSGDTTKTFNFGTGSITLNVDGNTLTPGYSTTANVSYEDSWTISDYNSNTITLTATDVANAGSLKNIQIGNPGDGVQIDLLQSSLQNMAVNQTSSNSFTIQQKSLVTAQLQQVNGASVTGSDEVALTSTGSVDLGNNVKFKFDGSNIGTTIAAGSVSFSVGEVTPADSFAAVLKKSADNGLTYSEIVETQAFEKGDKVKFNISSLSFQTNASTNESDSATLELEDGDEVNHSATLQIGANAGQTVSLELKDMRSKALQLSTDVAGGGAQELTLLDGTKQKVWFTQSAQANNGVSNDLTEYSLDISSNEKAQSAIIVIDDAIQKVSTERSRLGAIQNRLEYTVDNLKYMNENITAAESRVRDLDMAQEMTTFTKNNILNQAAQAMLAQANQMPQGVLQLLK